MARYSAEHKAKSREKILKSAGKLFRKRGYNAAGLDSIMESAGLTAGAFYAHYDSKASLLGEVLSVITRDVARTQYAGLENMAGVPWLKELVKRYLSNAHRQGITEGCVVPPLISEIGRADSKTKKIFQEYVLDLMKAYGHKVPPSANLESGDRMLATLCLLFGGMAVARAVDDPELADRILRACRKMALPEENPPETPSS